jgi:UDP-3-O-[3-hydroxymyristoyl] glucosamine N-acyltransferase
MTDKEKARLEFAKNSIIKIVDNKIHKLSSIHPTSMIGYDGFGFARDIDGTLVKINHAGNVIIEKDVEIRAFVTVDRAVNGSTIIGEGTKIDHHCHIAHGAKIGKWNTFANGCVIEGSCEVGDYNTFGTNVIVQRKVKIGSHCKFGSGAVVTKDVADNSVMVGNPAKLLKLNI